MYHILIIKMILFLIWCLSNPYKSSYKDKRNKSGNHWSQQHVQQNVWPISSSKFFDAPSGYKVYRKPFMIFLYIICIGYCFSLCFKLLFQWDIKIEILGTENKLKNKKFEESKLCFILQEAGLGEGRGWSLYLPYIKLN